MSLEYEPSSELLHISPKQLFLNEKMKKKKKEEKKVRCPLGYGEEKAPFRTVDTKRPHSGGGGLFCGRVPRLATSQGLLHLSSKAILLFDLPTAPWFRDGRGGVWRAREDEGEEERGEEGATP